MLSAMYIVATLPVMTVLLNLYYIADTGLCRSIDSFLHGLCHNQLIIKYNIIIIIIRVV